MLVLAAFIYAASCLLAVRFAGAAWLGSLDDLDGCGPVFLTCLLGPLALVACFSFWAVNDPDNGNPRVNPFTWRVERPLKSSSNAYYDAPHHLPTRYQVGAIQAWKIGRVSENTAGLSYEDIRGHNAFGTSSEALPNYRFPDPQRGLFGPMFHGPYYQRESRAVCQLESLHGRNFPNIHCGCGFYAAKDIRDGFFDQIGGAIALLDVHLYGTVIACERGYRAEYQRVNHIWVRPDRYAMIPEIGWSTGEREMFEHLFNQWLERVRLNYAPIPVDVMPNTTVPDHVPFTE